MGSTPPREGLRVEIASVENPELLREALDEARARDVRINRVLQGSGVQLLTDAEIVEMVELARASNVEVFLFVSARNSFEPLVDPGGGEHLRGEEAFADAVNDLRRCVDLGVAGVLIADIGLLAVAGRLRAAGHLGGLQLKTSAAIAPFNSATARLYEDLGATSINAPSSLSLADLKAIRGGLHPQTTLDIYVESPDELGGGLRYRDVPAFVEQLAPITLKFGLRNAPSLYPYGSHLADVAKPMIREKVRRAQLALAVLGRDLEGGKGSEDLAARGLDTTDGSRSRFIQAQHSQ